MYTYLGTAHTPEELVTKLKAAANRRLDLTKARREHPLTRREQEIIEHTIRAMQPSPSDQAYTADRHGSRP
jgi:ribosomal protein L13